MSPVSHSHLTHLECARCHARHDAFVPQGVCSCGSPLLARYDLTGIDRDALASRAPGMWRYHEVLPVQDAERVVTLGEGMTPLLELPRLGRAVGIPRLMMKDESLIPTGTFKARAPLRACRAPRSSA
jgi:threonine synthase